MGQSSKIDQDPAYASMQEMPKPQSRNITWKEFNSYATSHHITYMVYRARAPTLHAARCYVLTSCLLTASGVGSLVKTYVTPWKQHLEGCLQGASHSLARELHANRVVVTLHASLCWLTHSTKRFNRVRRCVAAVGLQFP